MVRRLAAFVMCTTALVGAAGAVVALGGRGGEEPFRYEQSRSLTVSSATVLSAGRVEAWVAKAPEPVRPAKRTPPARVSCRPGPSRVLRNPWSCTIRYRSGTQAHYRVSVRPDGFYVGTGTGIIEGCCIKTPALN